MHYGGQNYALWRLEQCTMEFRTIHYGGKNYALWRLGLCTMEVRTMHYGGQNYALQDVNKDINDLNKREKNNFRSVVSRAPGLFKVSGMEQNPHFCLFCLKVDKIQMKLCFNTFIYHDKCAFLLLYIFTLPSSKVHFVQNCAKTASFALCKLANFKHASSEVSGCYQI